MIRLHYFTLLIAVLCVMPACHKDKLSGSFSPLVGKWRLVKRSSLQSAQVTTFSGDDQELEFLQKGKYVIYTNGKKSGKGYTLIEDDHVNFRAAGMELARDELSFTAFYPQNIVGDSLTLSSREPGLDGHNDVYIRE